MPGKSLNLTKDDGLQKVVESCREKYMPLVPFIQKTPSTNNNQIQSVQIQDSVINIF